MATPARRYDIVLLGATGFTGALTAEYLARHIPPEVRWAVAGRDIGRLERLASQLAFLIPDRGRPGIVKADIEDPLSLQAMASSIWLLDRPAGSVDRPRRALEILRRQTEHLTRLVNDLLDVARADAGKMPIVPQPLNLADAVRRTVNAPTRIRSPAAATTSRRCSSDQRMMRFTPAPSAGGRARGWRHRSWRA